MQHTTVPATRTRDESARRIERAQRILSHARHIARDARADAEQLAAFGEKEFARVMIAHAQRNDAHVQRAQEMIHAELAHWGFHLHTTSRYAYQLRLEHLAQTLTRLSNAYAEDAMELRCAHDDDFAFVFGELHRRLATRAKHLWNAHTALTLHPRASLERFQMTFR